MKHKIYVQLQLKDAIERNKNFYNRNKDEKQQ